MTIKGCGWRGKVQQAMGNSGREAKGHAINTLQQWAQDKAASIMDDLDHHFGNLSEEEKKDVEGHIKSALMADTPEERDAAIDRAVATAKKADPSIDEDDLRNDLNSRVTEAARERDMGGIADAARDFSDSASRSGMSKDQQTEAMADAWMAVAKVQAEQASTGAEKEFIHQDAGNFAENAQLEKNKNIDVALNMTLDSTFSTPKRFPSTEVEPETLSPNISANQADKNNDISVG